MIPRVVISSQSRSDPSRIPMCMTSRPPRSTSHPTERLSSRILGAIPYQTPLTGWWEGDIMWDMPTWESGRGESLHLRHVDAMMKQAIHLPIYCGRNLTAILSLCIHACPCRDHYPPHAFPEREKGLELNPGIFPFTARTEHMDQYFEKPRMPRPAEPLSHTPQPLPWTGKETSNQAHYKPFVFAPKEEAVPAPSGRLPTAPPSTDPTDWVGMEITSDHLESHHHAA